MTDFNRSADRRAYEIEQLKDEARKKVKDIEDLKKSETARIVAEQKQRWSEEKQKDLQKAILDHKNLRYDPPRAAYKTALQIDNEVSEKLKQRHAAEIKTSEQRHDQLIDQILDENRTPAMQQEREHRDALREQMRADRELSNIDFDKERKERTDRER